MIYFIQAGPGGNIKIGYSADVNKRLVALQTSCPVRLIVLLTMPGDMGKETELHSRFSFLRVTGEWFSPHGDLLRYIEEVRAEQTRPASLKIYLAGKIQKNCWRHSIVNGLRDAMGGNCPVGDPMEVDGFPVLKRSIFGVHDYVGPFFASCDHGCWHGEDSHGIGANLDPPSRFAGNHGADSHASEVVDRCQSGVRQCDLLFAWIDSLDAYGTVAEIGFADALHKEIWISGPRKFRDMWFVYEHCLSNLERPNFSMWAFKNPKDALEKILKSKQDHIRMIREQRYGEQ